MRRFITPILALAIGLFASLPAHATGKLVNMEIIDRNTSSPLDIYRYQRQDFVAGQPGARYAIQITNCTSARVLVVLSVDGVNAITGASADPSQSGYVLNPHASAEITGWRKSTTETAAFYFTSLADSYAARTHRPDNVGIIGAAVFQEQEPIRIEESFAPAASAQDSIAGRANAPAPAAREGELARAETRAKRLGTGHGERLYDPTSYTEFERADNRPNEIVRLRYDSRARLIAMGVIPQSRTQLGYTPNPFPGFTPDPR
ncbi:hypothetical protein [Uliginosibacterium gangwonense]|uniref:hypothetical protein n=1 Tax=Uliginosibacterium gangwonense TaxID=392736 RepID=UPI00036B8579|nr:hypothetical protein [Uliginosibacterium gangwonense]